MRRLVTRWGGPGGIEACPQDYYFLQCFDTVGWVIWPEKTVPEITYNVFSGTLNPAESTLSAHASPQPKRHINRFSRLCTDDRAECLYCLQWFACFPLKIVPSHVVIWTSCNTWFIGPTRVQNANGNLIVSAVFSGLTGVTHWQSYRKSDRQTTLPGTMRRNNT